MKVEDLSYEDVATIDRLLLTLSRLKVCIDERKKSVHWHHVKHFLCVNPLDDRYWIIDHVSYSTRYKF